MSTEQSLDPQLIEQTKQQIRSLVSEIAQLSKSEVAPEEFYTEFLPRVVSALAAIGGAVWTVEDQGRLNLQYQINLQETKLRESEEAQRRHGRLLGKVVQSGEGLLVPARSGAGDEAEAGNPTDFLLVFGPLKTELETVAVVEIFQRPGSGPNTQKGYLRFLLQMCDLAGDFFKSRQLRHFGDRQVLWAQLEEFTRVIHTSLDPRAAAYTIANEGRRLIECDRVSVAIRKGSRCRIEAVSGQDLFDKRSNTVRLLGRLATAVVDAEEPIWYTGDTSDMAPQVEDAVQEYVDESHSKTVAVLPLMKPVVDEEEDDPDKREEPDPPIGALIVEQIEDVRVPQRMVQRVDVVAKHSSIALANALEHNELFLMPVWRALGKTRWVLKARTLPKTIAIASAVLAVILFLSLFPWSFKSHCGGTLEPVQRRDVFAGIDGVVDQVLVDHGSRVSGPDPQTGAPGTLLAKLRNTELNVKIQQNLGEIAKIQDEIMSIRHSISRGLSEQDRVRSLGRVAELEGQLKTALLQRELYAQQKKDLEIRAPIDGEVTSWDVENRLLQRPVQRGQTLMHVADPDGPWQLELLMPEKRMGHIERYRAKIKSKDPKDDLSVEFVLATDPDKEYVGKVVDVNDRAEVRGEEGNTVLIKVAFDRGELPSALRPGAEVSAKIYCGKRPVGYVMLCDAIAYVQRNILFRF